MHLRDEVRAILRRDGVVARREHPELAGTLAWLVRRGDLVAVLPGVYCATGAAEGFDVRLAALVRREPDAVVTGASAARLTFWPTLASPLVECALRWDRAERPGFAFSRRTLPPELVVQRGQVRLTSPALTALDLVASQGGDGIDRALRTRATTLELIRAAMDLTPGRSGNLDRRRVLLDSRDAPWSAAERRCHRLLREARIHGWRSNLPVQVGGRRYYLDVAFPALRLGVEIDGRLHEDDPEVFENDRERQNALVLEGWTVLRFTWRMLEDRPERVVAAIRTAITSIRSAR